MRYGNCIDGYFGRGFTGGMGYFGYGPHMFLIVGLIVIITLLIIIFLHNRKKNLSSNEAQEALKVRYVNGDITEEEYKKMKKMID